MTLQSSASKRGLRVLLQTLKTDGTRTLWPNPARVSNLADGLHNRVKKQPRGPNILERIDVQLQSALSEALKMWMSYSPTSQETHFSEPSRRLCHVKEASGDQKTYLRF